MGLDMYVYMARRPLMNETDLYDSRDIGGLVISEQEINEGMFCQIKPYCAKIRILNHYFNFEKISKDYQIEELSMGGFWDGKYQFKDRKKVSQGLNDYIAISSEDIEEKYTIDKEEIAYVSHLEEVMYWRKEYDVQDWIHSKISCNIENTGYYILDDDFIEAYNKKYPDYRLPSMSPTNVSALFYHEWY